MSIETIGYIGAFFLAYCGLPQALMTLYYGNSFGLSRAFLWSWYLGEWSLLYYWAQTEGGTGPIFWNYLLNIMIITPILYYSYFPRKES